MAEVKHGEIRWYENWGGVSRGVVACREAWRVSVVWCELERSVEGCGKNVKRDITYK